MSIHPHDVRELLGPQSATTPVSDEQVEHMVAVLNTCRAQRGGVEGTQPLTDETLADQTPTGTGADRPGESPVS